jgi:arginyl-tRNA synthetase
MSIFHTYKIAFERILQEAKQSGALTFDALPNFVVEPPRESGHGDIASNVAMMLAKAAGKAPRQIAEILKPSLEKLPNVAKVDIAGPGFINMRLEAAAWQSELGQILRQKAAYGDSKMGVGQRVNIEFVSANPTGPMHLAHVRNATLGDSMARLLEKVGYSVKREFYINDAGAQINTLARSVYLRYRELFGDEIGGIPEGLYPGEYMIDCAKALREKYAAQFYQKDEAEWLLPIKEFSTQYMLAEIRKDLALLNIEMDVYASELALVKGGKVEEVLKFLDAKGLLYRGVLEPPKGKQIDDWEPREQLLFRSTQFGDDVDRPLQKSDGSWTYFTNDIAYHREKFLRGADLMITVVGADHGGWVKRIKSAVAAITEDKARLEVKLYGIVNLFKNGVPVRMSKRKGHFVTFRELVEEVGADVVRFVMLTRHQDQGIDFDYAKVKEQTKENPVFYVQYAHARACSVFRNAGKFAEDFRGMPIEKIPLTQLTEPDDLHLIKTLGAWPRLVESAAEAVEPHRIAYYLVELASIFHGLWHKGKDVTTLRFIHADDAEKTYARLALVAATQYVLQSGLAILGCKPIEEMRSQEIDEAPDA